MNGIGARVKQVLLGSGQEQRKFGTVDGVFLPTLLTIMGAVMYLRTGWVVGNGGLVGGLLIILLANLITICTGLSISSIATNIRVKAGGAFAIISQSLGLEVGGSVSVPFYLAQSISVGFYIFAFAEGWQRIFPGHPVGVVVFVVFAACFGIAFASVKLAAQARYPILIIVGVSLFAVALGSFSRFGGFTQEPELWGRFPSGNFWTVFAVFFPAVTGVLTGVNMSGTLKEPRKSIPRGIMGAIVVTMFIYLGLAYWVSRMATPEELIGNVTIMVDRAAYGPAILAGILAATFSAALNSLVSAPRVLQAIAAYRVLPGSQVFAYETEAGEPRPAMYLTGVIGLGTLVFGLVGGGLNAIAPLMTMFFLIVYAVLNGVVMLEQLIGLISFRPLLAVPRVVPIVGLGGCLLAMLLINPIFSLVALGVVFVLYMYLLRRQLRAPWSDVRSGMFVTLAEWAAMRVITMPGSQERAWKPSLLVPVQSFQSLRGSYRFLRAVTYPRGSVHVVGLYRKGQKHRLARLESFVQAFARDGIFARVALLMVEDFVHGVQTALEILRSVFFRPNILFLPVDGRVSEEEVQFVVKQARENDIGAILFVRHPESSLGHEQDINVWIRDQSPDWEVGMRLSNLDLSLLLGYQLNRNWGGEGRFNLIMIVADEAERVNGENFLASLIELGRMPPNTHPIVEVGTLDSYLGQAPQADIDIFGMQEQMKLSFMQEMVKRTDASCIFVRDSGGESALA